MLTHSAKSRSLSVQTRYSLPVVCDIQTRADGGGLGNAGDLGEGRGCWPRRAAKDSVRMTTALKATILRILKSASRSQRLNKPQVLICRPQLVSPAPALSTILKRGPADCVSAPESSGAGSVLSVSRGPMLRWSAGVAQRIADREAGRSLHLRISSSSPPQADPRPTE